MSPLAIYAQSGDVSSWESDKHTTIETKKDASSSGEKTSSNTSKWSEEKKNDNMSTEDKKTSSEGKNDTKNTSSDTSSVPSNIIDWNNWDIILPKTPSNTGATNTTNSSATSGSWTSIIVDGKEIDISVNTQKETNPLENIGKLRAQLMKELSGKDELNTKIKELETLLEQKNIEVRTLEQINSDFQKKITDLTTNNLSLSEKNKREIEQYKAIINNNNKRLAEIEGEKLNTTVILENLAKVKQELSDKSDAIFYNKLVNIGIIFAVLILLFWITRIVYQRYKKKLQEHEDNLYLSKKFWELSATFNVVNVIITIVSVLVLVGAILYLKPELAVGLLFFGSAFIVIFKETIVSFIASIMIIVRFSIGDDIMYDNGGIKGYGTITKLTAFYIVIKEKQLEGHKDGYTGRIINIPNKIVFEQSLVKASSNYTDYVLESIVLPVSTKELLSTKDEFKNIGDVTNEKMSLIEELLNKELPILQDVSMFSTMKNRKYKKTIVSDDDKINITYSWLTKAGDFNIKEKVVEILLAKPSIVIEEGDANKKQFDWEVNNGKPEKISDTIQPPTPPAMPAPAAE